MHPKTSWAGLCKAATLLVLLAAAACSDVPTATGTGTVSLARAGVAQTPRPVTKTPTYPAIAVYIVFREYVNQNAGIRAVWTTMTPRTSGTWRNACGNCIHSGDTRA